MSSRKDGQNVAWKWVQENQKIPYEEFTKFYSDLIVFVSNQYTKLSDIENVKQGISTEHNLMLVTFPNNWFNKFLKIEPINYKLGYLSDSSSTFFKVKQ
jgi:hypothetical protein